jgi:hypothetical protein
MATLPLSFAHRKALACLPALLLFVTAAQSEDIHLNEPETPDQATVYYIDDLTNVGLVTGSPVGLVVGIDDTPNTSMAVGDLYNSEQGKGRIRKFFLMFRLPEKAKELKRAELHLSFGFRSNEKVAGDPLPPVYLYHASDWPAESWLSDPGFRGLTPTAFADNETFNEKLLLCDNDVQQGPLVVDVTKMIQANYQRSKEPVAVFRMEIADAESMDVTDDVSHTYNFWGPGQAVDKDPDRAPSLVLTFE